MSLHDTQKYFQNYIFMQESSDERLSIYADAYEARLLEAMEKTFPLLREELGEDKFDELCIAYLIENPSTYFSISYIGEKFSAYINSETAELDWAMHIATDAANAEILTQEGLQEIPQDQWANIIFKLHPSFSLLKKYRVWRKGLQVYYLPISETEYLFLKSIQDKLSFDQICEKLATKMSEEEVVNFALTLLLKYLSDELITGVNFTHELA